MINLVERLKLSKNTCINTLELDDGTVISFPILVKDIHNSKHTEVEIYNCIKNEETQKYEFYDKDNNIIYIVGSGKYFLYTFFVRNKAFIARYAINNKDTEWHMIKYIKNKYIYTKYEKFY